MSNDEGGEQTSAKIQPTDLDLEREVQRLRRVRSAAKGNVTKKIKQLTEWKLRCESYEDTNVKYEEFKSTVRNFYHAHESHHAAINDENEMTDSQEYFESEKMRISCEPWRSGYEIAKVRQLDDHKNAKCNQMARLATFRPCLV
jgi:hypothetical protein